MATYNFHIRLFDSFTGEIFTEMDTLPMTLPDEREKLINYMRALARRLENNPSCELGMTVTSERLINKRSPVRVNDHYVEGQLF